MRLVSLKLNQDELGLLFNIVADEAMRLREDGKDSETDEDLKDVEELEKRLEYLL